MSPSTSVGFLSWEPIEVFCSNDAVVEFVDCLAMMLGIQVSLKILKIFEMIFQFF